MASSINPLVIGVKDLVFQAGQMRELTLEVDAPEQYGEAMAIAPAGTPMTLELRLERPPRRNSGHR